jgi:hypothetical protein
MTAFVFRAIPSTDSGLNPPPIPIHKIGFSPGAEDPEKSLPFLLLTALRWFPPIQNLSIRLPDMRTAGGIARFTGTGE